MAVPSFLLLKASRYLDGTVVLVDLNAQAVPHGSEVVGLGKVPQSVVLVNIILLGLYFLIISTTFFILKML